MSVTYTNIAWAIIEALETLIQAEFPSAKVFKNESIVRTDYPDAGTFEIKVISDADDEIDAPYGHVKSIYTFNIWIHLRYLDKEEEQEKMTDLAEHLKALLHSWTNVQKTDLWYNSRWISVEYGIRDISIENRKPSYLRSALTTWECQVSETRED